MTYEYLSNIELIYEVGLLEKLIKSLASQAEKLAKLRAEGKVSDSAYKEVFEDLRKRAEVMARKNDELLSAANGRVKQMDGESIQLKHQLELLEVRHAISSIPDDKYKVTQEGILTQLAEIEETKKRINELITNITENSRRIGQYVSGIVVARPQEPLPQILVQPTVKPVEPTARPAEPSVKPKTRSVEVRWETSKPKVKKCSRCQDENLESASYCYNCGAKL